MSKQVVFNPPLMGELDNGGGAVYIWAVADDDYLVTRPDDPKYYNDRRRQPEWYPRWQITIPPPPPPSS